MSTKLTLPDALNICYAVKKRIMKEDRPVEERLQECNAISYVMNVAQATINKPQNRETKSSLEILSEALAEKENKT